MSECASVIYLCRFLDALSAQDKTLNWDNPAKDDLYWGIFEKWFVFGLIWSIGATVNEEGRNYIDSTMRDIESFFPHMNTVYDYFISPEK